jgi:hypothetical protein
MFAPLLVFLSLAQVPCAPSDSTVVCGCKQLNESSCTVLAETNPELYRNVLRLLAMAKASKEASKPATQDQSATASPGCPEPPENQKCEGQNHHLISKRIWEALEEHSVLKGLYKYRDKRFEVRAVNKEAHCGWKNTWHEHLDNEVVRWIEGNKKATAAEFEAWLRWRYNQPDLKWRFPDGF